MLDFINCDQSSADWLMARLGIPTASRFSAVLAKGRSGASKTRQKYIYELAGEIITGQPTESFTNNHMERGHALEPEARSLYEFNTDHDVQEIGFIRNGRMGCSPDGLVGERGMLEIKTKLPHIMVETILRQDMPPEHVAQTQGQLLVAEREWVDFVAYWPGFPLFTIRKYRDEKYISNLESEIGVFLSELDEVVSKIRGQHTPSDDNIVGAPQ